MLDCWYSLPQSGLAEHVDLCFNLCSYAVERDGLLGYPTLPHQGQYQREGPCEGEDHRLCDLKVEIDNIARIAQRYRSTSELCDPVIDFTIVTAF